ncbi:MAG: YggS family pyridoxal phosphate-dependent enzyme [Chthonomonadales bacterium]|nr:YggS family pyridoxal phosphate-dependent enzyme [Chthonomonadales bacterium]
MSIASRLADVRGRIDQAAIRSGRRPDEVRLVTVTKTVDIDRVREAVAAGASDLGENYAQELGAKRPLIASPVRWHFIGRLQKNKARHVTGAVELIHGVDSLALAAEIGKRAVHRGIVQDILLEVRIDPAETKGGVDPAEVEQLAETVGAMDGVRIIGLMGMPPICADPENARPYFVQLREIFGRLPDPMRRELSMGMSGDYEVAVQEGATIVRVGTAIFGPRR